MAAVTSAPGNSCRNWVAELRIDMKKLGPPLSQECCIYRVPSNLRRVNENAYTPQFVSIGPLHYGDENLKKMEEHKLRYLERFLKRAERISVNSLEDFVGYVKENEQRIRRCYAETLDHLNGDDFARMVLVDAAFIIEHILRYYFGRPTDEKEEGHQLIFDIPFLSEAVFWKDLMLLENQLPFFVLEELCRMVYKEGPVSEILQPFFTSLNPQNKPMPKDFKHFTDLLRYYQLPQPQTSTVHTNCSWFSDCSSRLSKVLQRALQALLRLLCQKRRKEKQIYGLLYSATELHEAGVTFKVSESKCLLDIKLTDKGELEMPCFYIDDNSEALIRNVMALEQCHYLHEKETSVSDFFILMDCLINSDKDVELLVRNKILDNKLGSNQQVASLVNKLCLEIFLKEEYSCYLKTIKDLNKYYEKPHHKRMAALRRDYFKTPWRSASTIAAVILLLLTLVQAICSILSL